MKCIVCRTGLKKLRIHYIADVVDVLRCPQCKQLYYDEESRNHEMPELLDQDGEGSPDAHVQRKKGMDLPLSEMWT
jgi:hypothetical protein